MKTRWAFPGGWTASQIPNGDQGHRDGVGARQDLMRHVCRSLSPETEGCRRLTGSLGDPGPGRCSKDTQWVVSDEQAAPRDSRAACP